jgi:hypothetical protein
VIVPASEVERHTALLEAVYGPRRPRGRPRNTVRIQTPAPTNVPVRTIHRIALPRHPGPGPVEPRPSTYVPASTVSTSANSGPTAGLPGIDRDLSEALRNASIEPLAPILAREGVTNLKRLRQACFSDDCALGDLVDHDFWKRLLVRGDLSTLDFFLLRQIAVSD